MILEFIYGLYFLAGVAIAFFADRHFMSENPPYSGWPAIVSLRTIRVISAIAMVLLGPPTLLKHTLVGIWRGVKEGFDEQENPK